MSCPQSLMAGSEAKIHRQILFNATSDNRAEARRLTVALKHEIRQEYQTRCPESFCAWFDSMIMWLDQSVEQTRN
jgi:hypothetical protein